ncbi:DUF202 domain-containing protein [Plantactinospora sp. KBS50]|uniref:DUF202 domain-containing protein n=1 Tax=Plantactinospora sp. KBS50 TaxID=2024580 RepID=UPI0012FDDBB9|nr:DUF202 domain-containing protein [Plantactinospora sp. KBS50]
MRTGIAAVPRSAGRDTGADRAAGADRYTGADRDTGAVRDPGLQAERTALAWSRTALALAVAGLLVARQLLTWYGPWMAAAAASTCLVAAAGALLAHRRYRRWTRTGRPAGRIAVANAAAAAAAMLIGAASLVALLARPPR